MRQLSVLRSTKLRPIDLTVGVITFGLIAFGLWQRSGQSSSALTCKKVGVKHTVIYNNSSFQPKTLKIRRCDVVSIVNNGDTNVEPIFGTHENHVTYPGYQTQAIQPNEYIELDAVQKGDFLVHNHLKDTARLNLTIK